MYEDICIEEFQETGLTKHPFSSVYPVVLFWARLTYLPEQYHFSSKSFWLKVVSAIKKFVLQTFALVA